MFKGCYFLLMNISDLLQAFKNLTTRKREIKLKSVTNFSVSIDVHQRNIVDKVARTEFASVRYLTSFARENHELYKLDVSSIYTRILQKALRRIYDSVVQHLPQGLHWCCSVIMNCLTSCLKCDKPKFLMISKFSTLVYLCCRCSF